MRRQLLAMAAVLTLGSACAETASSDAPILDSGSPDSGSTPNEGLPTTYYVIRHAERDPGEDPPLNEEGMARAERLADALQDAGIDEIVATTFLRAQQTGEPLAERTETPIAVAPFERISWPQLASDVARWQLEREVVGATYLMVGHSSGYNTTLLEALGAPVSGRTLAEQYQDLVILVRERDAPARLSILQYGGASSLDP